MTNNIESEVIRAIVELITPACTNVFAGKSQVIYPKANIDLRCIEELTYGVRYRLVLPRKASSSPSMRSPARPSWSASTA